jgi:hypothetical protein
MNVLHINQSDISGGAAIAAFRLHQGLLTQGIDSRLLVGMVLTKSDRVAATPRKPGLENLLYRLAWRMGLHYINYAMQIFSTYTIFMLDMWDTLIT